MSVTGCPNLSPAIFAQQNPASADGLTLHNNAFASMLCWGFRGPTDPVSWQNQATSMRSLGYMRSQNWHSQVPGWNWHVMRQDHCSHGIYRLRQDWPNLLRGPCTVPVKHVQPAGVSLPKRLAHCHRRCSAWSSAQSGLLMVRCDWTP